jgi:site-specific DNA-methyltransferase (adenine-specific)
VLADLPYGTTACKWDSVLPLDTLWKEYKRVLRPRGAVVLTGSQPFTTALISSNLKWFRYEWIWEKAQGTGYLNANRNPMKSHENILVFYSRLGTYNPQRAPGKPYRATSGAVGGFVRDKTVGGYLTVSDGGRYPTTVLRFDPDAPKQHPTQKPVALMAYLIRTYSNPGDLVLDNTAGSGTTGVAAIETGRRAILIEQDADYYRIMCERIAAAQPPLLPEAACA